MKFHFIWIIFQIDLINLKNGEDTIEQTENLDYIKESFWVDDRTIFLKMENVPYKVELQEI